VTKVARRGLSLVGAALLAAAGWVACDLNPQQLPPGFMGGSASGDSGVQNTPPPNGGAGDAASSADGGLPRVADGGDASTASPAEDAGGAPEAGDAGDAGDAGEAVDADAGPDE
jgi:hypothetical protein